MLHGTTVTNTQTNSIYTAGLHIRGQHNEAANLYMLQENLYMLQTGRDLAAKLSLHTYFQN